MKYQYVIIADYEPKFRDDLARTFSMESVQGGSPPEENFAKLPAHLRTVVKDHLSYLNKLRDNGILSAAGPCGDFQHAILVYEAASREEVTRLIEDDPYVKGKVCARWEVFEWMPAIGRWIK